LSGFIVVFGCHREKADGWTASFGDHGSDSVTGFCFPSQVACLLTFRGLSLICAGSGLFARYGVSYGWLAPRYVISSLIALYFNVFVLLPVVYEGACLKAMPRPNPNPI